MARYSIEFSATAERVEDLHFDTGTLGNHLSGTWIELELGKDHPSAARRDQVEHFGEVCRARLPPREGLDLRYQVEPVAGGEVRPGIVEGDERCPCHRFEQGA